MSPEDTNTIDDPEVLVPRLFQRINATQQSRKELNDELMEMELLLGEFVGSMDVVTARVKNRIQEPRTVLPEPPVPAVPLSVPPAPLVASPAAGQAGMTLEEFKTHMGAILQGSLDAVSEKLSDKIAGMLKELKGLSGPAREYKLQELKEAAEFESIDLSKLYVHQEVQSNLEDIGVEEKESKGIDSTLEKLRRLKGLKPKPGGEKA
ncbi:MAG: hypothetical protein HQL12_06145 [Candidatus Omnitrophica bacterium]|nr:hypothetical protein [Candidatus Omnitrophota bacterium]